MKIKQILGAAQSPAFKTLADIIQAAGSGMIKDRHESVRFPTGTTQVWEFNDRTDLSRPAKVVVVFLKNKKMCSWKPTDLTYEQALAHYQHQASLRGASDGQPEIKLAELPKLPNGMVAVLPEGKAAWQKASGDA